MIYGKCLVELIGRHFDFRQGSEQTYSLRWPDCWRDPSSTGRRFPSFLQNKATPFDDDGKNSPLLELVIFLAGLSPCTLQEVHQRIK